MVKIIISFQVVDFWSWVVFRNPRLLDINFKVFMNSFALQLTHLMYFIYLKLY